MQFSIALLALGLLCSLAESRKRTRGFHVFRRGVDTASCLAAHNAFRAQHGAPPLQWDDYLVKHATAYAQKLGGGQLVPDSQAGVGDKEGENLANAGSCAEAVEQWIGQLAKYKGSGACANPPVNAPAGTEAVAQLMWKGTEKVGVAVVGNVVVARYFPPGNFEEEYEYEVEC